MAQSFIVVMNCHRQNAFRVFLPPLHNHRELGKFPLAPEHHHPGFNDLRFVFLMNDVHAKFYAFIADKHGWACDEFAHFMLALATKRTIKSVFGIGTTSGLIHVPSKNRTVTKLDPILDTRHDIPQTK